MSLIGLLVAVVVLGMVLYLIRLLPIEKPFKDAAIVIFIVIAIIWLLTGLGGYHSLRF